MSNIRRSASGKRIIGYAWRGIRGILGRVYQIYTALGLNIRRRAKKRLPARVIRVLEQLEERRGLPAMLRVDNGPEFISRRLDTWCKDRKITLAFIQPGKPPQNAYVERLNGSIRRELFNAYVFRTLDEVREKAQEWQHDYNHRRPHKSLGYQIPVNVHLLPESSTSGWAR